MSVKEVRSKAISNIISKEVLREVQTETMALISDTLANSYGPDGSTTQIRMDAEKDHIGRTEYTKDGHKILGCIRFNKPIEMSIVDDLQDITRSTVRKVGDGTTSAVILSNLVFTVLCSATDKFTEKELVNCLENEVVPELTKRIKELGRETTLDDIYNIAYTATDGNKVIAEQIRDIYKEFGMGAYIEVKPSNTDSNMIKSYDGVSFDQGYFNSCFINNSKNSTCEIRKPEIYIFEDAIDTPEMMAFLSVIVQNNIIAAMRAQDPSQFVPTVIFSTRFGEDVRSSMDDIFQYLNSVNPANRPPLLMITNISKLYQLYDLATLSGAKTIKKYIDPEIQKMDIKKGLAPTPETIKNFAGTAEMITADATMTKVLRPAKMYNEDGTYSDTYTALVEQLTAELHKYEETKEELTKINLLKRRIRSLECNMVDYYIAGISHTDRNALIDAVEDAVLNCRSAAENGVANGSNFNVLYTLDEMIKEFDEEDTDTVKFIVVNILHNAYLELYLRIYKYYTKDDHMEIEKLIVGSGLSQCPFNLRTERWDGKVLTSAKADEVILEAVSRIVGLMFKTNQAMVASPVQNTYTY